MVIIASETIGRENNAWSNLSVDGGKEDTMCTLTL
jgi:hypothetical protein